MRLGEIQEFWEVNKISRRAITPKILSRVRDLDEKEEIEPFLREILPDFTETPHTSTEIADILTSHITYSGRAHLTAFVNKGKSSPKVTSKQVAHQIMRLKDIDLLDFIVLLAVGDIQDDIKRDVTFMAEQKAADYMIVDAIDIARLFIAYCKICHKDGTPYQGFTPESCRRI